MKIKNIIFYNFSKEISTAQNTLLNQSSYTPKPVFKVTLLVSLAFWAFYVSSPQTVSPCEMSSSLPISQFFYEGKSKKSH